MSTHEEAPTVEASSSPTGYAPKVLDGINVICTVCGEDLTGKVRFQNDKAGTVRCLRHGRA